MLINVKMSRALGKTIVNVDSQQKGIEPCRDECLDRRKIIMENVLPHRLIVSSRAER